MEVSSSNGVGILYVQMMGFAATGGIGFNVRMGYSSLIRLRLV